MSVPRERLAAIALGSLSIEDQPRGAAYADPQSIKRGTEVQMGRTTVPAPADSRMVFVDLEAGVNWGHRCLYLLVDENTGEVWRYDSRFPPPAGRLRLLFKGSAVQDWMLLTRHAYEEA